MLIISSLYLFSIKDHLAAIIQIVFFFLIIQKVAKVTILNIIKIIFKKKQN